MALRALPSSPDAQRALWPDMATGWWTGQDFDRDYDLADIEMMRQGTWVDFAIGQLLGTGLNIPVGPPVDRRDVELPSVPSIPKVVPKPLFDPGRIFKEAIGRRIPQIKEVLPVPAEISIPTLPRVRTGPSTEVGGPRTTDIHAGARTMPDLGHILSGIGDFIPGPDFFDLGANIYNYARPAQIVDTGVVTTTPQVPGGGGGGAMPPVQFAGGACERDPRNDYVLKFSCNQWKWVKKRKRRSKRLATSSDIKDLSSLKGVLGDGKNLSTWIATHR